MTPCPILDHKNDYHLLLCDEVWDMSPAVPKSSANDDHLIITHQFINSDHDLLNHHHPAVAVAMTKQDYQHTFDTYLRKEIKYMTTTTASAGGGGGYLNLLQSNSAFLANSRFKAIHWFFHCRRRFNFGIGSVFNAVNYLDRFIHYNQCHGWSYWMMELVSLACLSIAIKFGETNCPPSLHQIIQEGLEYCFEPRLTQRMELKILKSLNWELNSITPYSYVEFIITWELNNSSTLKKPFLLVDDELLTSRINDLLIASSLDVKLLVYRPSVIAMSALRCVLDYQDCLSHIATFIPQAEEQNLQFCYKMMQEMLVKSHEFEAIGNPSSPDTVLTKEPVVIYEEQVDLSLIDGPSMIKNDLKRKKEQDDCDCDCVVKHKKYIM